VSDRRAGSIRPATREDAAELARLRYALYREHGRGPEPLEDYVARLVPFALQALASDAWRIWVAEADGGVVGAAWLHVVERVPRPGEERGANPIGYLTSLFVEPSWRNGGIGSDLVGAAIAWAGERGVEEMIVWPTDRSVPFYERAGFAKVRDPLVLRLRGGA
jgi:GNAT superfamily N-acetyltransferase